jgi:hypothetical protein
LNLTGGVRNQSTYLLLSEGSVHLRGWSDANMPMLRYFLFVGGALLALLLGANALLPSVPASGILESNTDLPAIRIHSDRKWPERVVFDTSQPMIAAAPVTVARADAAVGNPAVTVASPKARVREAFAQLPPSEKIPAVAAMDSKKPELRPQPKRKLAKARPVQQPAREPTILVAQQPRFGLFGNTW